MVENGYLVTFLGWNRDPKANISKRKESVDGYKEFQFRFKAPWNIKSLFFLPLWWSFIFFKLMVLHWDVAQAGEFASIPPTVIAGRLKRKPIIYEMIDIYEDQFVMPKIIRDFCVKIDKLFMWLATSIILADDEQIKEINGIPNSNVVAIYDSPPDEYNIYVNDSNIKCLKNNIFTIFYAGWLPSSRALNLDKIFRAVENIENVKIVIAGYGDLVEEIETWSHKIPDKIQFIGEIYHAEVLKRSIEANLLFVLRDPIVPVNKYICGSKVLEAMMCGTPILVNKGTSTAKIVKKENFGLVVDAKNIEEIKEAIIKLRDNPELCKEFEINARNAYEQRYSWKIMKKRLLCLYNKLDSAALQRRKEIE